MGRCLEPNLIFRTATSAGAIAPSAGLSLRGFLPVSIFMAVEIRRRALREIHAQRQAGAASQAAVRETRPTSSPVPKLFQRSAEEPKLNKPRERKLNAKGLTTGI